MPLAMTKLTREIALSVTDHQYIMPIRLTCKKQSCHQCPILYDIQNWLTKMRMIVAMVMRAVFISRLPRTNVTMKTADSEIAKLVAVSSTIVRYCS